MKYPICDMISLAFESALNYQRIKISSRYSPTCAFGPLLLIQSFKGAVGNEKRFFDMYGKGFWAIPKEVMETKGLSPESRLVYAILFTRMNGENMAWPGQKYIAEVVGCSERSVRRYVDELVDKQLITVHRQGLRRTNRYSLTGQVVLSRPDRAVLSRPAKLSYPTVRDLLVRKEKKEKGIKKISEILKSSYENI